MGTIQISLSATYDKEITAAKVVTSVEGLPIKGKTRDGCADVDEDIPLGLGHVTKHAQCPISVGTHTEHTTVTLSSNFPAVKASVKAVITDQDDEQIACQIIHFQVTTSSNATISV